jgi:hypothetical protein
MIEVDLQIPSGVNGEQIVKVVERVCTANDLACARKGTLASYPGCIHWHFRLGRQKGTLEITWWESEDRLWFKAAKGRTGEWINEALPKLKKEIEVSL